MGCNGRLWELTEYYGMLGIIEVLKFGSAEELEG
jgi:hypothetical protein